MIGNYERNLFEQQTPYLQWLKERKTKQMINKESIKGKQIIKLPFFSCEDSVKEIVKESPEVLHNTHIVVFYGANGAVICANIGKVENFFTWKSRIKLVLG